MGDEAAKSRLSVLLEMSNLDRKRVLENDVIQQLCSETSTADPIREAFLKRLQTFDVLSWNGKPINPPQCAQHGWEFAEENILKCSTCQSYLSVELPSPSQRKSCKPFQHYFYLNID